MPEDALKGWQLRAIDHTSDESGEWIRDQRTRGGGSALLEIELDIQHCWKQVFAIFMLEQWSRTIIKGRVNLALSWFCLKGGGKSSYWWGYVVAIRCMYAAEKNCSFTKHVACLNKFCQTLAKQLISWIHLEQAWLVLVECFIEVIDGLGGAGTDSDEGCRII